MENTVSKRIEDELDKHGTYATNTVGVSMRPLFKTRRDVVVLKTPDRRIKKYDVVMYVDSADRYILHRVIGERDGVYVIRGDNTFKKEYVPKNRVIAYMVSFNRNGKHRTAEDFSYKLYSRVWNLIYPVRFLFNKFFALCRKTKRIFKKSA
ncbi:MAG: hypothetical protein E7612_10330 [Ruminococcaceae bacterium]|nr:hypothetical protein [Oscillospiraceae bacterium]